MSLGVSSVNSRKGKMFMSPSVGRKNVPKKEDESQLILNSPSSDGDGNSILNGNTEVGFVFPNVKLKKTPVSQVSFLYKRLNLTRKMR